ncbi:MAG: hypothetical protein AAFW73_19020 [Bacteroidota bacterium]
MITEYQYWIIQQRLEETLQGYLDQREPVEESGGNRPEIDQLFEENGLNQFIYRDLGIVGGAYILADISRNELLVLQNKTLQPKLFPNHSRLPFIGIPYKYPEAEGDNQSTSKFKVAKDFNELVDALFIGTQDRQTIEDSLQSSPHFYRFLPNLLSDEERKGLLPFERKLVKNGQKVIYCTVGEVLFNLYVWRLLFRLIQRETLQGWIQRDRYDEKFEMQSRFWEQMTLLEEEQQITLPETNWIKALKYRYEEHDPVHGEVNQRILQKWQRLTQRVDAELLLNSDRYSFYDEYFHLGLVEKGEKGELHTTRGLLDLVRYTIHIAKAHLGWTTISEDGFNTSGAHPRDLEHRPQKTLNRLYTLERHLHKFFSLGEEASSEQIVNHRHLQEQQYQLDRCIQKVAKEYLFGSILNTQHQRAPLQKALTQLHRRTRFPILPYFYELVLGKVHTPKEHLMVSIWNSTANGVPLNLPQRGRTKEPAVAFVSLSLRPIWKLEPDVYFTKNNDSIYWANKLSEFAYIRLARITDFFRTLSRPLIDQLFYGEIIKKQIQQMATSTDINALSHEMSKIVDNIFELSNVSLMELYGYDEDKVGQITRFLSDLSKQQEGSKNKMVELGLEPYESYVFEAKEVDRWKIIPNYDRFRVWNKYLNMWVGRRGNFVLDIQDDAQLLDILKEAHQLAARMYLGGTMQNFDKFSFARKVREYQANFDEELEDMLRRSPRYNFQDGTTDQIQKLQLRSLRCDHDGKQVIKQNAFLRILLASITNIFEHSLDSYYLSIRFKNDLKGNPGLRFCFVNPCKKKGNGAGGKSEGTLPVLQSCLLLVQGELEYFGCPREDIYKKFWAEQADFELGDRDIWLTKFIIPLQNIFADH